MKNRTLALIGAGLLAGALVLGDVGTVLAQSTGPFGPGGVMRMAFGGQTNSQSWHETHFVSPS